MSHPAPADQTASTEPRFPIIASEQMTARQAEVAAAIAGGPRGGIRGPFLALIHHPDLADRVQSLGEHLRYGAAISLANIEMIVLIVARHMNCQYEWFAHARIARTTTDLPEAIIQSLQAGQKPADLNDEQDTLYTFCKEVIAHGQPTDRTYTRAVGYFGRAGVLDMIAIVGYYSMIAMVLNTSQIPLPEGTVPPLAPLTPDFVTSDTSAAGARSPLTPALNVPASTHANTPRHASGRPLRVGLMVPINNTTMEGEMLGWLPEGSTCRTLRIPRGQGLLTEETLPAYRDAAIALAQQFNETPLDVIAYGCTAAGFILGPKGDADIAQSLAQVTGLPVVTTARSMMLALKAQGANNISLLTPYQDDVNSRLRAFLQSEDIEVGHFDSFYAPDVVALGQITESQVAERAKTLCKPDADAMFIACSQLPTLNVVDALSQSWGKPVLSSIQVTAQLAMEAVHIN